MQNWGTLWKCIFWWTHSRRWKLGPPPAFFFPVFQGEHTCWQRWSGLDAAITHLLTYKPPLCCPFITYSHRKARKRRNARGRLRFCADWKMASCTYRQCKCIWLEVFDATHQLGMKKRRYFRKLNHFSALVIPAIKPVIWPHIGRICCENRPLFFFYSTYFGERVQLLFKMN